MDIIETLGGIISIITIIGSFWGGYEKIIKPALKRRKELLEHREQNAIRIQEAVGKLDRVLKEVLPNSGSSLRDSINRMENNISNLNNKVDNLEETHKIALNMQQIAFWISGKLGEVTYASPAMCKLVRRVESEMLGNGWVSCISHIDTKRISEAWEDSIRESRTFDETYTFVSGESMVKVHGIAFHKKDNKGNYIGSYGTLTKVK